MSGVNLKVEAFSFPDLSSNSPLILSERCASTPKDTNNELPSIFFDTTPCSIRKKSNNDLSFLNRIINFAPIPIFGRRNLQILNNYVNKGVNVLSEEAGNLLLRNEDNIEEYMTKPNFRKIISDRKVEDKRENSTSIGHRIKQEIKKSEKGGLGNSNKVQRVSRVSIVKRTNCTLTKRRRSNANESKPILKVNSKRPKSPKLLTAIRAKLKQNRERLRKENEKAENPPPLKFLPLKPERKSRERMSKKIENSNVNSKQTKNFTTPKSASTKSKENQTESFKRKQMEVPKISKTKPIKQPRDESRKSTIFKAHPIRKYSPLPKVKKRNITVPQSPKLGKRRYLNSYH